MQCFRIPHWRVILKETMKFFEQVYGIFLPALICGTDHFRIYAYLTSKFA